MIQYFGYVFGFWNLLVMLFYGLDKVLAKTHSSRIPEVVLLAFAFLFGGLGALLGFFMFNHKTAKWKFRLLLPLALILNVFIIGYSMYYVAF